MTSGKTYRKTNEITQKNRKLMEEIPADLNFLGKNILKQANGQFREKSNKPEVINTFTRRKKD